MGKVGRRRPPKRDLTGMRFGKLTVITMVRAEQSVKKEFVAQVICDCGNTKLVAIHALLRNMTTSCGCKKDQYLKNTGKNNKKFTGHEEISGAFWSKFKNRAIKDGKHFELSIQDSWDLYLKQGRKCIFTGLPIQFGRANRSVETTASLDRIDNSKGYILSNVQWVHKDVNRMRNIFTAEYFIEICKLVALNS